MTLPNVASFFGLTAASAGPDLIVHTHTLPSRCLDPRGSPKRVLPTGRARLTGKRLGIGIRPFKICNASLQRLDPRREGFERFPDRHLIKDFQNV
ncbi:hypothetical protein [Neotabrizicola sp. VNH66]|uniref:hypothetical protein n=1 Tax=Neotabrizicola sp. VNH66 TaxID=3400918 RepID=UPI003C01560F